MRSIVLASAAVALLLAGAGQGRAAPIVSNGDFELAPFNTPGTITNWSVSFPSGDFAPVARSSISGLGPRGGSGHFASFESTTGLSTISQVLTTTAGNLYDLDFYVATDDSGFNQFQALVGGGQVYSVTNLDTNGSYIHLAFQFVATSASTLLEFRGQDIPAAFALDDVSVQDLGPSGPTSATPEPASMALLGMGAVGLLGYGWRRRQMGLVTA